MAIACTQPTSLVLGPVLGLVLAGGCGPTVGGDASSDGGSSEGSTSSPTASGPTSTVEPTTGGTTTSAATTSVDSTTAGDESSTGEPLSVCDPQPVEGIRAGVSFDDGVLPDEPLANPYVYACTIADWVEGDASLVLSLACDDGPHTLAIGTSVGVWFDDTGDFVVSVIHSDATWEGVDQLVTLRRADGELVLAGALTPWAPDLDQVPPDFFAPLGITLLPDVCEVEPLPSNMGGFVDPCYAVQRQALRFELSGQVVDVHDQGVDQLSPYILLVQSAELRHDIVCTDTGDRWYQWVAVPPIPD